MPRLFSNICLQCGKPYKGRGKLFCGNSCRVTYTNLNNNVAKRLNVRAKISACAKASNRQAQLMTEEARKKAVTAIGNALRGRTLSEEHKKKIGEGAKRAGCIPPRNDHLVREQHWNWQGGHSTVRNKCFNSPEYAYFRDAALNRDDYTCQSCGKRGGKLHVHHAMPWGPNPELRYEVSNGVTLCTKCHHAIHRNTPRPVTVGPRTLSDLESNPS